MTSGDLDLWDTVITENICTPGYVIDVCAKNGGDRTNGLDGVRGQTNTHTERGPYAINNIDWLQRKTMVS